jgi:hypothetical protein
VADTDAAKKAKTPKPDALAGLTKGQLQLIAYVVTLCVLGVVILTLVLVFHYAKASDATSVLAVVIPIFTAVIGVLVGGGAGAAAGSAGKKAVQDDLAATKNKMEIARNNVNQLQGLYQTLATNLQTNLSTVSRSSALLLEPREGSQAVVQFSHIDDINNKIGEINGLLQ